MAKKDFHWWYMSNVNNAVESGKYQQEKGDYETTSRYLDSAEKFLDEAKVETEKEIARRDKRGKHRIILPGSPEEET